LRPAGRSIFENIEGFLMVIKIWSHSTSDDNVLKSLTAIFSQSQCPRSSFGYVVTAIVLQDLLGHSSLTATALYLRILGHEVKQILKDRAFI
jgi:hypothetical protein